MSLFQSSEISQLLCIFIILVSFEQYRSIWLPKLSIDSQFFGPTSVRSYIRVPGRPFKGKTNVKIVVFYTNCYDIFTTTFAAKILSLFLVQFLPFSAFLFLKFSLCLCSFSPFSEVFKLSLSLLSL